MNERYRHESRKTYDHVQISGQEPVLQDATVRDIDPLAFIRHHYKSRQHK
jgi:hypothetical protein